MFAPDTPDIVQHVACSGDTHAVLPTVDNSLDVRSARASFFVIL